jgi:hypothetical protein
VRSELKASQAMEAWVHRYCRPYRDDDVCWDVEVSRGQDRLPSDDVTVNEAVVSSIKELFLFVHALFFILWLSSNEVLNYFVRNLSSSLFPLS